MSPIAEGPTQLSRRISRLQWVSLSLCIPVAACTIATFGFMSYWLSPAAIFSTIIYNATLLGVKNRDLKQSEKLRIATTSPRGRLPSGKVMPCTSHGAAIGFGWFLVVVWLGVVAVQVLTLYHTLGPWGLEFPMHFGPVGCVEVVFDAMQVVVFILLLLKMGQERRDTRKSWAEIGSGFSDKDT